MNKFFNSIFIVILLITLCFVFIFSGCDQMDVQPDNQTPIIDEESNTNTNIDAEENNTNTNHEQILDDSIPEADKPGQIGRAVTIVSEDGNFCTLSLGMSLEETIQRCDEAEIIIKKDTNYNIYYNENYMVYFNKTNNNNNQLIIGSIQIINSQVATEKGLKVGDPEEKVEQLQGADFSIWEYDDIESCKSYIYINMMDIT